MSVFKGLRPIVIQGIVIPLTFPAFVKVALFRIVVVVVFVIIVNIINVSVVLTSILVSIGVFLLLPPV
jgi:hypothetical protein